jgi:hypothetical protein
LPTAAYGVILLASAGLIVRLTSHNTTTDEDLSVVPWPDRSINGREDDGGTPRGREGTSSVFFAASCSKVDLRY